MELVEPRQGVGEARELARLEPLASSRLGPRPDPRLGERRAGVVAAFSLVVMLVEVAAGVRLNSLALISDGLHTATHVGVMAVTIAAFRYARSHAADPRFAFGTGKVGDLAAFASGVGLAVVALFIALESVQRLIRPEPVALADAAAVAVLSLIVGLLSAALLRQAHHHAHGQGGAGHRRGRDLNLWAAYLHMLADVATSVLSIAALAVGAAIHAVWLDPVVGLVNTAVVAAFAVRLLSRASAVLLDLQPADAVAEAARRLGPEARDVRLWSVGPGRLALSTKLPPDRAADLHARLAGMSGVAHVLVELDDAPKR